MPTFNSSIDPTGIVDGYTTALPYKQSDEDTDLVSHLLTLWNASSAAKLYIERRWNLNYMFLKGEHFLYRDKNTGAIVHAKDKQTLKSMNNVLRPASRALVGKLASRIPTFTTIPATDQQDELFGSKVADVFFRYFYDKEELDVKYVELMEYLTWAGTGVCQLYWDPTAGNEKAYCEQCNYATDDVKLVDTECPLCTQAYEALVEQQAQISAVDGELAGALGMPPPPEVGGPNVLPPQRMVRITDGDAKVRVIDPRDVYIDPTGFKPEELRYVFVRKNVPITELRRRFPTVGPSVMPGIDSKSWTDTDYFYAGAQTTNDLVTLYEYHEAPSLAHPDGQIIYMAKNMILEKRPGYYRKFRRLPFFWQFWTKNAREFWAEAPVTQAWSRQRELNDLESGIHSSIELTSFPMLLNPTFSGISLEQFSGLPGAMYNYNAPHRPEFPQLPQLPAQVFQRRPDLIEDIRQQFAITDADSGVSQSDPNGRAAAILAAESGRQLTPINVRNHSEWKALYRCLLVLARDMYDEDRKFAVAGEEWMSVYSFNDLRLSTSQDLRLEIMDGLSENQAIREQQVMNWVQTGVLNDPKTGAPDPKYVAKLAKIKLPNAIAAGNETEYAAAQMKIHRAYKDQLAYQYIMETWNLYHFMAMQQQGLIPPGAQPPMPGASPGGSQSSPGGTPNAQMSTQNQDPTRPSNTVAQEAGAIKAGADQAGEAAAKQST